MSESQSGVDLYTACGCQLCRPSNAAAEEMKYGLPNLQVSAPWVELTSILEAEMIVPSVYNCIVCYGISLAEL